MTWDDGDGLEGAQDAEGAQSGQVADLDAHGGVAGEDDDEVEPVPRTAQVRHPVQDQALGHGLDHHFARVDPQEHVPVRRHRQQQTKFSSIPNDSPSPYKHNLPNLTKTLPNLT